MHRLRAPLSAALSVVLSTALAGVFAVGSPPSAEAGAHGLRAAATTTQVARLRMHPKLAQPGTSPASPAGARSSMSAEFRPARQGRKVVLQQRRGTRWVNLKDGVENARGVVDFNAPTSSGGRAAVYRAVAVRWGSLGRVASAAAATDRWGAVDFSDQFSGTTLNSDFWSNRVEGNRLGYNAAARRSCSRTDSRARRVANGTLRLSVRKDPNPPRNSLGQVKTCPVTGTKGAWRINGFVSTQGKKSFKYGYLAARMKFQTKVGQHGAFWLWPQTREATSGSAELTGAEIDIIEWFGTRDNPDREMQSCIYHYPEATATKIGGQIPDHRRFGSDWTSAYHVFSLEWTPARYIFRIDGKEIFRSAKGVSGQREMLMLSLLASDWELSMIDPDRLPAHMYVDWVRVWDRDPTA
jgi:beta-glucanase (GH16 family)